MPATLEALSAMARAGGIEGFKAEPPSPRRHGDAAIIEIDGVILKDAPRFSWFEYTSSRSAGEQLRAALDDPSIARIVLVVDSPGGTIDGTQELAYAVHAARGKKPIVAFADGLMASAAYYIGSAANEVYISGDNTLTGSIGVVTTHTDYSGLEQRLGMKTTEIYAGKYKRIASSVQPLSDEGRDYLQAQVDRMYSTFVHDVAMFRGVSAETVLKRMGDGRVFVGRQGIDAGLADGVATLDLLIGAERAREVEPMGNVGALTLEQRVALAWERNANGCRDRFIGRGGMLAYERRILDGRETGASYLNGVGGASIAEQCRIAWEQDRKGCRAVFMSLPGLIAHERRRALDPTLGESYL